MASTINASTSGAGGVITTADNSGILNLQSAGTTVASISNTTTFNFPALATRITGDFTNGTIANRVCFQSSTTNGSTIVTAIPTGTQTISAFSAETDPAATNMQFMQINSNTYNSGNPGLIAGARGTAIVPPMTFWTNSTEQMRIATDGTITSALGGMQVRSGTAVLASSTSVDFTSIPSWVKRITVMFGAVSSNGTSSWQIQLGTSAGIQTTGYLGAYGYTGAGNASINLTTGFGLYNDTAADLRSGTITLTLLDASNNTWTCSGLGAWSSRAYCLPTAGAKTLTTALDRIRITTLNGTDTFDAGSINILYE